MLSAVAVVVVAGLVAADARAKRHLAGRAMVLMAGAVVQCPDFETIGAGRRPRIAAAIGRW